MHVAMQRLYVRAVAMPTPIGNMRKVFIMYLSFIIQIGVNFICIECNEDLFPRKKVSWDIENNWSKKQVGITEHIMNNSQIFKKSH